MTRRPRRWRIEHDDRGNATVLCNGRQLAVDLTPERAVQHVRRHREPGEKVVQIQPDGDERDITRRM